MFFVVEGDPPGAVTGPHTVGELRRRLGDGRMSWEDQVCDHKEREWGPARRWRSVLEERHAETGTGAGAGARLVCGQCGGGEVQRARAIYEGGTTMTVSEGTGGGMVMDFGGGEDGVGMVPVMGVQRGRGKSATLLAQRCAPPDREEYRLKAPGWGLWAMVLGAVLAGAGVVLLTVVGRELPAVGRAGWPMGAVGVVMFLAGLFSGPTKRARRESLAYYHRAYAEWERRYYCHRCGWLGVPGKGGEMR